MDILGVVSIPNWLLWILLVLITLYVYYTWHFNDLKAVGIDGPKPYPVIGNLNYAVKYGMREVELVLTKQYGKVFSVFGGRKPTLVIADVNILRQILIKDFPNFVNRQEFQLRGILKKSIFDLQGKHWKHVRTHLTPAFSTGKLKLMTLGIEKCAQTMADHIMECADKDEVFEAKEVSAAYSMDVIARTAFSLNLDTQKEQNHIFIQKALKLFNFTLFSPLIFIMFFMPFLVPILEHVFRIRSSMPPDVEEYFKDFITKLLEERRNNPEKHNDFVQMMLNSEEDLKAADDEVKADLGEPVPEESKKKGLSSEDILAQCYLLLIGGYETTGSTLGFVLYHLARYPDVQDKVLRELDEVLKDKDRVKYEDIAKLPYLEMVVYETLRLYPPFPAITREAARTVQYEGVQIPAGTVVTYPVRMMQMDPDAFPDPEKFIPERFTPEEKAKRDPLYFAAFGSGPRNCIGTRLALLEVKMAVALALRKARLLLADPDQGPIVMVKTFFAQAEGGIYLKAVPR